MRLDKDWAICGHKFADPGRKDTIKACIYVKELVRFFFVENGSDWFEDNDRMGLK